MVVDTSASVAILLREPEADLFNEALAGAPVRLLSALSRVEVSFAIEGRKGDAGRAALERLLLDAMFEVVLVTPRQA